MPQTEERRARDRELYAARKAAGTLRKKTLSPERRATKNQWRDVGRAFERFRRLPEDVQQRVLDTVRGGA